MASLSFSVKDLPPEGTRIACVVGREELQLEEKDPGIRDVLALTATIRAEEADFQVEGELNGLLLHDCVRCLEEFAAPADVSFRAVYKDPGSGPGPALGSRRPKRQEPGPGSRAGAGSGTADSVREETDSYPVMEQRIELQEMLREQLILSIPMQPLCSEACQGLCQVCGQNLNVQRCGCEAVRTESPFAILQDAFKLKPWS